MRVCLSLQLHAATESMNLVVKLCYLQPPVYQLVIASAY